MPPYAYIYIYIDVDTHIFIWCFACRLARAPALLGFGPATRGAAVGRAPCHGGFNSALLRCDSHASATTHIYIYIYVYIYISKINTYIFRSVCIYASVYIYIYIYRCIYTYIYIVFCFAVCSGFCSPWVSRGH